MNEHLHQHIAELEARLAEEQARAERAEGAVRAHYSQRGDDRCHLDDLKLYHEVLGEGINPYVGALPPTECMLESCRRYIEQRRCPGPNGVVPLPDNMTIQQLTDEVKWLRGELEIAREEQSESVGVMVGAALQGHSIDLERLEHERQLSSIAAERDSFARSYNSLSDTAARIFREIGEIAEKALGHPIEAGHTAAYAAELMAEKMKATEAERSRYRLSLQAIAESDFSERLLFARFAWLKARETLGLATTGEGEVG